MGFVALSKKQFGRSSYMTFSIVQCQEGSQRVVGTVWADDESGAEAMAPMFFPSAEKSSLSIQLDDDREIPLRMDAPAELFH
jgi:hypothetical protein